MTCYDALIARTRTIHRPIGPVAYDCVKIIVVRSGSAILFSEFGERPIRPGDVVLLGANVLCGSEPEGHVTVTTIYADTDFLLDQLFWQHADVLRDRLDAQGFADTIYTEPAQVLRLGEDRAGMLMPWLDELVALSVDGVYRERFHRMQALWHAVIDQISPFIRITPYRTSPHQRARLRPTLPRDRRFTPLRAEARQVRDALQSDIARGWTLPELAGMVHLSTKQLSRVFTDAYGKTPLTYLTMLRVEEMARLLRETDLTIEQTGRRVGWRSRNRASAAFRECVGITPSRYRDMRSADSSMPTFETSLPT
ncbi:helix-turn-helix domain-containing protein [Kocuria indica]|jgi:AraC family transcriptional regulator|uniref:Helix-turn-helix transcriptional regulator n=2 Tax=Micrococcales TaxID=85006 RepID=A0A7T4DI80_9MICO|nr:MULTISPECIES: AraC family transcriptional regulator [Micrococcales]MCT1616589.1 AraC family transcriptional regulator [Kocuria marina]MDO4255106.1 AraC family transcriptional regulator [Kocuria sp.]NDO78973.1 helix-turn-helix domain-containing protein [Kocuria indica]QQB14257.1 helix-turn-helix transcriptional regulator [Brevibacterium casei]